MIEQLIVAANFPRMLRVGEAARVLHVHPNTLRKWSDDGLIASYRVGRRGDRRFALQDLDSFLLASRAEPQDQRAPNGLLVAA